MMTQNDCWVNDFVAKMINEHSLNEITALQLDTSEWGSRREFKFILSFRKFVEIQNDKAQMPAVECIQLLVITVSGKRWYLIVIALSKFILKLFQQPANEQISVL